MNKAILVIKTLLCRKRRELDLQTGHWDASELATGASGEDLACSAGEMTKGLFSNSCDCGDTEPQTAS